MDNTTETILKSKLEPHLGDRTLILVTYKASMLTLADRLIVLNEGQVGADGPKEQVLQALSGAATP